MPPPIVGSGTWIRSSWHDPESGEVLPIADANTKRFSPSNIDVQKTPAFFIAAWLPYTWPCRAQTLHLAFFSVSLAVSILAALVALYLSDWSFISFDFVLSKITAKTNFSQALATTFPRLRIRNITDDFAIEWAPSEAPLNIQEGGNMSLVCIVGGVRSFTYLSVHQSILDRVVHPVQPAAVSFVLSATRQLQTATSRAEIPDDLLAKEKLVQALQAFNPIHIELHNTSTCSALHKLTPSHTCCDDQDMPGFMQLLWIERCFEVGEKFEDSHDITFDLMLRLRPDVAYLKTFPGRQDLLRNGITLAMKHSTDQPGDWLFAMVRLELTWFRHTYLKALQACEQKMHCRNRLAMLSELEASQCLVPNLHWQAPEYSSWFRQPVPGKFLNLGPEVTEAERQEEKNHAWPMHSYVALDLGVVIVRGPHSAECFRLLSEHEMCEALTDKGWDTP